MNPHAALCACGVCLRVQHAEQVAELKALLRELLAELEKQDEPNLALLSRARRAA